MKYLEKISNLLILSVIIVSGIVLNSCSADEETTIIPKTLDEYKAQLSEFVTSEKTVVNNCTIGYNKGDFKVGSTSSFDSYKTSYLTVLNSAEVVLNSPDVTIEKIVTANKTLAVPGKAFTSSLFISDRRTLNDSTIVAETLNAATIAGTATTQVADSSKVSFTTAITKAKSARDASTTVERQVDDAVTELGDAKKIFMKAIIK